MKFIKSCLSIWTWCLVMISTRAWPQKSVQYDVCVYGGTSAGVIAAYTAQKMKKRVILIEPGKHLGGLTSGGLGYTDIGNKYAITGISRDFYRRVGKYYGKFEQWIFEPHVAEEIFNQYILEAGVKVLYNYRLTVADKKDSYIRSIRVESSGKSPGPDLVIDAAMFIDCSYEGDLMAAAGVPYALGRESNSMFNEKYNGVQLRDKHQFQDGIDPFNVPGKPESGLLWGVSESNLATAGEGDKKVQAYNFRICLTSDSMNMVPIEKPQDFNASKYELLLRVLDYSKAKDLSAFLKFDLMPNHKTDINNNGPFSTDMIGMNYDYPEANYTRRQHIQLEHENYVKGLLYFIGHDPRMPVNLRTAMLKWGYPKDEYTDNDHWSWQMYVREARRMKGAYIMTQSNCEGKETVPDGIGMAAYTMDSHNCQRLVINGMVKNEGDVQVGGFGPYPIAYRAIIPAADYCNNLLVPVALSATHIAYGSIRMEPVFMVLAQSAAVAAVQAIDKKISVQKVAVTEVQEALKSNPLGNGSIPEVLVDNNDSLHVLVSGEWNTVEKGAYGPNMFITGSEIPVKRFVRFQPELKKSGKYHIYTYVPKLQDIAIEIPMKIYDGKMEKKYRIETGSLKVEGQTSGEWVDLGVYLLPKGRRAYAEINNGIKGEGIIVADAVLFVPVQQSTAIISKRAVKK